jgi:hypothetical protein
MCHLLLSNDSGSSVTGHTSNSSPMLLTLPSTGLQGHPESSNRKRSSTERFCAIENSGGYTSVIGNIWVDLRQRQLE